MTLFFLFLLSFIIFDLWSSAAGSIIKTKFHSGQEPSWKMYIFYAFFGTLIFMILLYLAGVPLAIFEGL